MGVGKERERERERACQRATLSVVSSQSSSKLMFAVRTMGTRINLS